MECPIGKHNGTLLQAPTRLSENVDQQRKIVIRQQERHPIGHVEWKYRGQWGAVLGDSSPPVAGGVRQWVGGNACTFGPVREGGGSSNEGSGGMHLLKNDGTRTSEGRGQGDSVSEIVKDVGRGNVRSGRAGGDVAGACDKDCGVVAGIYARVREHMGRARRRGISDGASIGDGTEGSAREIGRKRVACLMENNKEVITVPAQLHGGSTNNICDVGGRTNTDDMTGQDFVREGLLQADEKAQHVNTNQHQQQQHEQQVSDQQEDKQVEEHRLQTNQNQPPKHMLQQKHQQPQQHNQDHIQRQHKQQEDDDHADGERTEFGECNNCTDPQQQSLRYTMKFCDNSVICHNPDKGEFLYNLEEEHVIKNSCPLLGYAHSAGTLPPGLVTCASNSTEAIVAEIPRDGACVSGDKISDRGRMDQTTGRNVEQPEEQQQQQQDTNENIAHEKRHDRFDNIELWQQPQMLLRGYESQRLEENYQDCEQQEHDAIQQQQKLNQHQDENERHKQEAHISQTHVKHPSLASSTRDTTTSPLHTPNDTLHHTPPLLPLAPGTLPTTVHTKHLLYFLKYPMLSPCSSLYPPHCPPSFPSPLLSEASNPSKPLPRQTEPTKTLTSISHTRTTLQQLPPSNAASTLQDPQDSLPTETLLPSPLSPKSFANPPTRTSPLFSAPCVSVSTPSSSHGEPSYLEQQTGSSPHGSLGDDSDDETFVSLPIQKLTGSSPGGTLGEEPGVKTLVSSLLSEQTGSILHGMDPGIEAMLLFVIRRLIAIWYEREAYRRANKMLTETLHKLTAQSVFRQHTHIHTHSRHSAEVTPQSRQRDDRETGERSVSGTKLTPGRVHGDKGRRRWREEKESEGIVGVSASDTGEGHTERNGKISKCKKDVLGHNRQSVEYLCFEEGLDGVRRVVRGGGGGDRNGKDGNRGAVEVQTGERGGGGVWKSSDMIYRNQSMGGDDNQWQPESTTPQGRAKVTDESGGCCYTSSKKNSGRNTGGRDRGGAGGSNVKRGSRHSTLSTPTPPPPTGADTTAERKGIPSATSVCRDSCSCYSVRTQERPRLRRCRSDIDASSESDCVSSVSSRAGGGRAESACDYRDTNRSTSITAELESQMRYRQGQGSGSLPLGSPKELGGSGSGGEERRHGYCESNWWCGSDACSNTCHSKRRYRCGYNCNDRTDCIQRVTRSGETGRTRSNGTSNSCDCTWSVNARAHRSPRGSTHTDVPSDNINSDDIAVDNTDECTSKHDSDYSNTTSWWCRDSGYHKLVVEDSRETATGEEQGNAVAERSPTPVPERWSDCQSGSVAKIDGSGIAPASHGDTTDFFTFGWTREADSPSLDAGNNKWEEWSSNHNSLLNDRRCCSNPRWPDKCICACCRGDCKDVTMRATMSAACRSLPSTIKPSDRLSATEPVPHHKQTQYDTNNNHHTTDTRSTVRMGNGSCMSAADPRRTNHGARPGQHTGTPSSCPRLHFSPAPLVVFATGVTPVSRLGLRRYGGPAGGVDWKRNEVCAGGDSLGCKEGWTPCSFATETMPCLQLMSSVELFGSEVAEARRRVTRIRQAGIICKGRCRVRRGGPTRTRRRSDGHATEQRLPGAGSAGEWSSRYSSSSRMKKGGVFDAHEEGNILDAPTEDTSQVKREVEEAKTDGCNIRVGHGGGVCECPLCGVKFALDGDMENNSSSSSRRRCSSSASSSNSGSKSLEPAAPSRGVNVLRPAGTQAHADARLASHIPTAPESGDQEQQERRGKLEEKRLRGDCCEIQTWVARKTSNGGKNNMTALDGSVQCRDWSNHRNTCRRQSASSSYSGTSSSTKRSRRTVAGSKSSSSISSRRSSPRSTGSSSTTSRSTSSGGTSSGGTSSRRTSSRSNSSTCSSHNGETQKTCITVPPKSRTMQYECLLVENCRNHANYFTLTTAPSTPTRMSSYSLHKRNHASTRRPMTDKPYANTQKQQTCVEEKRGADRLAREAGVVVNELRTGCGEAAEYRQGQGDTTSGGTDSITAQGEWQEEVCDGRGRKRGDSREGVWWVPDTPMFGGGMRSSGGIYFTGSHFM
eukprot:GHVQ01005908.1.p1 GENE.GHVQ01005908.1~~GHVQ01005908.1.p1  ORF type:complete len:2039 (+),score=379.49 GHVQ01005908.1:648-6764(+)